MKMTTALAGMLSSGLLISGLQACTSQTKTAQDTYTNPVLCFDYSDPDVVRTGGDYWMTASSFNCVPGLPILHSTDLVHWEIVNYALDRLYPEEFFSTPQHGKGVWAPCIKFHDGWYYIYWGDPDFGIFMTKTLDPAGKWSEPVLVKAGKGLIDPSPLWDDDGKVYLAHAWAASRSGLNSIITVCEMNAEGTACISDETMVFDGNRAGHHTVEGAKFYKRNGYYYIFAPAGGVATGWQLVMRSKSVYGPYEARKVMAQGESDINGPHQGAWIDTPSGEDWFIHFQEKQPFGRIVHLNPLTWDEEGWCVIGEDRDGDGCGEPVRTWERPALSECGEYEMATSDEFDVTGPGLQWQWNANRQDWFGFGSGYGFFRIYGHRENVPNLWGVPNLLLQKMPAEAFVATTKMTFNSKGDGDRAGLVVMGLDYGHISVLRSGGKAMVQYSVCHDADKGSTESVKTIAEIPLVRVESGATPKYTADIWFRVESDEAGLCRFLYSTDGEKFIDAGETFQAREGKWIGAKTGFFCSSFGTGKDRGWIDIDYIRFERSAGTDEMLDYCAGQTVRTLAQIESAGYAMSPRNIAPGDTVWKLCPVSKELWTEGFWPGVLWYDYEYTGDSRIREAAEKYTGALGFISEIPAYDHDLGFIIFCSYGNGYRLTGNPEYKKTILATADRLASLYNPAVGTILSWPREMENLGGHNTIMDNMLNLEMLFWAAENGGKPEYAAIARSHADTTMKYNFRPDGTSYHVAVYDPVTGRHIRSCTHQGYADDSMWARGQAWGIYGYTMCYRFTKDPKYLDFACRITDVYLSRLPEDMVPYWDFEDPEIPDVSRDASAAAVVASALIELSGYAGGEKGAEYLSCAKRMLFSLYENYRSTGSCPAFLLHSTGHRPAGTEIDYSIIYADYYFIEALLRLRALS